LAVVEKWSSSGAPTVNELVANTAADADYWQDGASRHGGSVLLMRRYLHHQRHGAAVTG
jgi:hypothetical protein